jgi:hypothetical protein
MKKILLTLMMVCGVVLAYAQTPAPPTQTPPGQPAPVEEPKAPTGNAVIKFEEESFDFGNAPQGPPSIKHEFKFTNTGKDPLILSNVQASCGCTTPHWPKEPIMPGKTASIVVEYNALHAGPFTKTITVTSNATEPTKMIVIKGNIEAKPVEQTTPEKQPSMLTK